MTTSTATKQLLPDGYVAEYPGRDDYGRSRREVYAMRPVHGWGCVAVITVLPKCAAELHNGARHMVTDLRRETPWHERYPNGAHPPVFKGLKAAREYAATLTV